MAALVEVNELGPAHRYVPPVIARLNVEPLQTAVAPVILGVGKGLKVTVVLEVAVEVQPFASFTTKVLVLVLVTAKVGDDTNPVPFQLYI